MKHTKKLLSLLLAVAMLLSMAPIFTATAQEAPSQDAEPAAATKDPFLMDVTDFPKGDPTGSTNNQVLIDYGTCGPDITWRLIRDPDMNQLCLVLEGSGPMYDYNAEIPSQAAPWASAYDCFVYIEDGITSIGKDAFYDMSLTVPNIPASVERIGSRAFGSSDAALRAKNAGIAAPMGQYYIDLFLIFQHSAPRIAPDAFAGRYALTMILYPRNDPSYNSLKDQGFGGEKLTWVSYTPDWSEFAGSYTDQIQWKITYPTHFNQSTTGRLTLSGTGMVPNLLAADGLSSWDPWTTFGQSNITEIVVEEGITEIECCIAANLYSVQEISLPKSLESFQIVSVMSAQGLIPNIKLAPDNDSFYYDEATKVLYSKDMTTLYHVPMDYTGVFTIPESVTSLKGAFYCCSNLTGVNFPSNLKEISDYTFCGCSSLTDIQIPDTVTTIGFCAFANSGLQSIQIPDSVTTLKDQAFVYTMLSDVPQMNGIAALPAGVFYGCSNLTKVSTLDRFTSIGTGAFCASGLTEIPSMNGITEIPSLAFAFCPIVDGKIPAQIKSIGDLAFFSNASMTVLSLPDGLETIGGAAFAGCSITDLTIPDRVTTLGLGAFSSCGSLLSAKLPAGLPNISANLFSGCSALKTVQLPSDVQEIEAGAFGYTGLESFVVPDSVTEIGMNAFANSSSLKTVTLGRNVRELGMGAFSYDQALTSINIPEGVEGIPANFLQNASALEEITLPSTLKEIGSYAFQNVGTAAMNGVQNFRLPEGLTKLGYCALSHLCCPELKLPSSLEVLEIGALDHVRPSVIELPAGVRRIEQRQFNMDPVDSSTGTVMPGYIEKLIFRGDRPEMSPDMMLYTECTAFYPRTNKTWTDTPITTPNAFGWYGYNPDSIAYDYCDAATKNTCWELSKDGTLSVEAPAPAQPPVAVFAMAADSATGEIKDYESITATPWYPYLEQIRKVVIRDSVNSIGQNSFSGCPNLKEVVIEGNVSTIAPDAFSSCTALETVKFEGDAPVIQENAFRDTHASVTYPADNSTWTESNQADYGGQLEWKPEQPKPIITGIAGSSMNLKNSLSMIFYVNRADFPAAMEDNQFYIEMRKSYRNGKPDAIEQVWNQNWETNMKGLYGASFPEIAAKEMSDEITVQVFYADGSPASAVYTDSVRTYAYRMLQNNDKALNTVLVDMLNYGTEAQQYFGYAVDQPANGLLTEEQKQLASQSVTMTNRCTSEGKYYGTSLKLGNNLALYVYFRGNPTKGMYATVRFTNHSGISKETIVDDLASNVKNTCLVKADTMAVADAGAMVTVTVYNADGSVYGRVTDSIESYLARMFEKEHESIYEAVMKFAVSAKTYFDNRR